MNFFNFLNSLGTPTQSIDEQFESFLKEGIQDTHILKTIFLQGASSGSGKDFVLDQILSDKGLVEIPTAKVSNYLFGRNKINFNDELRNITTKNQTELREKLAILGRNGLIINGTSDSVDSIAKIKTFLENLGYDCLMLLVNVSNEVAQQRNVERGKRGGRIVPENQRVKNWTTVQQNRPLFAKLFGEMYLEFDNSVDLRNADPQSAMQKHQELNQLNEQVQQFLDADPQSEMGQMWMQQQLEQDNSEDIDETGVDQLPNNAASNQAKELGLQYYGSGRYGKNRQITHRSVNGRLKENPKKKVNEMLEEAVSVSFTADTTEELNSLFDSLFNYKKPEQPEHPGSHLSNLDAKTLLTLGKKMVVPEDTFETQTVYARPKISLAEVRERQQSKLLNESIYSNEGGMSLNGYAKETPDPIDGKPKALPGRAIGVNNKKKGKPQLNVARFQENMTSGDAITASVTAKKEDDLKKVGIDLATFRAKRHIV